MASKSRDKWLKYRFLENYKPLVKHMPKTKILTKEDFWDLLKEYRHVILKPVWGSRGQGVIQVSSIGNGKYKLHYENIQIIKQDKEDIFRFIKSKIGSASYMIQRRVNRPTINGQPFDMRVIIQRKKNSSAWVVTGKVIKVAGKGYIVSNNSRSQGTLLHFNEGIKKSSINQLSATKLESEINRVSILSAKRLSTLFPGHRIYGLDIGPDNEGRIWIIETNLFPAMSHFLKLNDKTMYRRIIDFKNN